MNTTHLLTVLLRRGGLPLALALCLSATPARAEERIVSPGTPLTLDSFEELGEDTIVFDGASARVFVNFAITQDLVDRFTAPSGSDYGVIVLGTAINHSAALDFTGKGDIRLDGDDSFYSGTGWTPDGAVYRTGGFAGLTLSANSALTDTDPATSRSLEVYGDLTLGGDNTYSGGTLIASTGSLTIGSIGAVGTGSVAFEGTRGRLVTTFAANQAVVDVLSAGTETDRGALILAVDSSENLDFTGKGPASLGGVNGQVYSGTYTPDGTTYRLAGGLQFAAANALADIDGETSRDVIIEGSMTLDKANSYTGGTTITTGADVTITDADALGTGDITVGGTGAVLQVTGEIIDTDPSPETTVPAASRIVLANNVTLTSGTVNTGGTLSATIAEISGTVTFNDTSRNVAQYLATGVDAEAATGAPALVLNELSIFSGTLSATGGGQVFVGDGNGLARITGNLDLAEGAGVAVIVNTGARFESELVITSGNGLYIQNNLSAEAGLAWTGTPGVFDTFSGNFLADLTLEAGSFLSFGNGYGDRQIILAGDADAHLFGASIDFSSFTDVLNWDFLTGEYVIMTTDEGSIYGDLVATGVLEGYAVDFVTSVNGKSLTMVVGLAAVPEPSSYAALAGLGVLGLALMRRRHS